MDRVGQLEAALVLAEKLGYTVRQEWLGGTRGGACRYGGRKWLFVDLSLPVEEQLEQVLAALREEGVLQQRNSRQVGRAA